MDGIVWYYLAKGENGEEIEETFETMEAATQAKSKDTRETSCIGNKTENAKNER